MAELRERAISFLRRHGMDPGSLELERGVAELLDDMRRGLAGETGCLEMIPTYIELKGELPVGEKVIAVDAGGTNLRIATVHFDKELRPVVESFRKYTMPGVEREVGKTEFFGEFARYLLDLLPFASRIGFCFSFSIDHLPNKDGRVNSLGKEVKAPEVLGELVGENLIAALRSGGHRGPVKVVLVNDTVTTMLAGRAGSAGRGYGGYLGFILGTGTNVCYLERNRNIVKKPELDPKGMQLINVESGNYSRVPLGSLDREFIATTQLPEQHLLEKLVSGAYLGPLALPVLRRAASEGLLGSAASEGLSRLEALSTEALHAFLCYPGLSTHPLGKALAGGTRADRTLAFFLVDRLIERAAKLAAMTLAGTVLKAEVGEDPCAPVCIAVEGSVFWGLRGMKQKVEFYLKSYLEESKGRYFDIIQVENASLVGAAIASLTN